MSHQTMLCDVGIVPAPGECLACLGVPGLTQAAVGMRAHPVELGSGRMPRVPTVSCAVLAPHPTPPTPSHYQQSTLAELLLALQLDGRRPLAICCK